MILRGLKGFSLHFKQHHHKYRRHILSVALTGAMVTALYAAYDFSPLASHFSNVSAASNWVDCRTEGGAANIPSGSISVTVILETSVSDMSQAFLLIDSSGNSGTRAGNRHIASGYLADASTLIFERGTNSGPATEISYSLVECFNNEFEVKRGEITLPSGQLSATDTILEVDPTKSIVLVNSRTEDRSFTEDKVLLTGELSDSITVTVQRAVADSDDTQSNGSTGPNPNSTTTYARYEVVEFSGSSDAEVQTGEIDFGFGESISVPISSVDPTRSWLYCSWDATYNGLRQTVVGCDVTDDSTLTFYRHEDTGGNRTTNYENRVRYYVVEFPENTVAVQRGSAFIDPPSGSSEFNHDIPIVEISSVDKAFPFVTNTTNGAGTAFPRNKWIEYLSSTTNLRTSFWHGSTIYDQAWKYWQVVEFPDQSSVAYGSSGQGGHIIPTRVSVSVNEGLDCTPTRNVLVAVKAQDANEMLISNDQRFLDAEWESFGGIALIEWELAEGDGEKTIYTLFESDTNSRSTVVFETIYLDEENGCEDYEVVSEEEEDAALEQAGFFEDIGCAVKSTFREYMDIGSPSREVLPLQRFLQCMGYFPDSVATTGYFGPVTDQAVRSFQDAHEIDPDGFIGNETRAVINSYQLPY